MQFLKKLNRQERVVEEVRLALKPYYTSKRISKGDYKEILRKCVPKVSSVRLYIVFFLYRELISVKCFHLDLSHQEWRNKSHQNQRNGQRLRQKVPVPT